MTSKLPGSQDKMRKVLRWVGEELGERPEKTRKQVFEEAEFKFDLSPQECEFLNKHFANK